MVTRWSKSLISGHKEIDEEHKELINIASSLEEALKAKDTEEIAILLAEFEREIREHFASEEEIMEKYEISQFSGHQKLHQNFLEMWADIIEHYQSTNSIRDLKKDFRYACNKMKRHIINFDVPVFKELQEKIAMAK